jgi:HlyD family secretion protein
MKRKFVLTLIVVAVSAALVIAAIYGQWGKAQPNQYQTAGVKRTDIVSTINATGTVEPEEVVDVGAQVAGQIRSFGTDRKGKPIDYGSSVEAGTILARIDESLYQSDVTQASAALAQAQANQQRAEADVVQMRAKLAQAESDWKRAQQLGPSEALAQSAYDAYKAGYETARANVQVGEATVAQTRGAVLQAQAGLKKAQRNLGYCTIVSPVAGVIIDRRVNIGQTVVASLNAPSLFLIAKDLKRMQVWVPVNEADIGHIHAGQAVTFTIDALPGETFRGAVGKIRLNAAMTQNVVNYTVEVVTDNSKGKLLPYLTANVQFEIDRHDDVLAVPSAALRWTPGPQEIAPEYRANGNHPQNRQLPRSDRSSKRAVLWVTEENGVRPVPVTATLSDGVMTEVQGDGVSEGLKVVVGEVTPGPQKSPGATAPGAEGTSNPFAPQFPRGRGGRGSR